MKKKDLDSSRKESAFTDGSEERNFELQMDCPNAKAKRPPEWIRATLYDDRLPDDRTDDDDPWAPGDSDCPEDRGRTEPDGKASPEAVICANSSLSSSRWTSDYAENVINEVLDESGVDESCDVSYVITDTPLPPRFDDYLNEQTIASAKLPQLSGAKLIESRGIWIYGEEAEYIIGVDDIIELIAKSGSDCGKNPQLLRIAIDMNRKNGPSDAEASSSMSEDKIESKELSEEECRQQMIDRLKKCAEAAMVCGSDTLNYFCVIPSDGQLQQQPDDGQKQPQG